MIKESWLPATVIVLGVALAVSFWQLAGAVAKANLLEEQLDMARDSIVMAHDSTVAAQDRTDAVIEQSSVIAAEAALEVAEAQAAVIVQEAEAEASFRRAEALAADNPTLERAIQEMRGDAIVASMEHEEAERVSAAALLAAQNQIERLTLSIVDERLRTQNEILRINTALDLAIQRGDVLEDAIAPGFFGNIFRNAQLVIGSALVGGAITYLLTSN